MADQDEVSLKIGFLANPDAQAQLAALADAAIAAQKGIDDSMKAVGNEAVTQQRKVVEETKI